MSRLSFILLFTMVAACSTSVQPKLDQDQIDKAVRSRVVAGLEYLQLGEPQEARRHLTRAIELNDDSAEAHNALSLLYKYEGDVEREQDHLKKALRADSDYGPARNNYGAFYLAQGDFRRALAQFKKAADITSYSGRGVAYENMGRAYLALEQDNEALDAFNKALRLNPAGLGPLLELAELYLKQGDARAAGRYYDRYAEMVQPQSARGLWVGIRITAAREDRDAQASYELALQNLYPDSRELKLWKDWRQARGGS